MPSTLPAPCNKDTIWARHREPQLSNLKAPARLGCRLPTKDTDGARQSQHYRCNSPCLRPSPCALRRSLVLQAQRQPLATIPSSTIAWGSGLAKLFAAGATLGPLLDGIHGTVHLLAYDSLPLEISGLHSSWWVPLLLGCFYVVAGSLQVLLDEAVISPLQQQNASASLQDRVVGLLQQFEVFRSQGNRQQTERVTAEGAQLPAVALATGVTASLLALSAVLYVSDVPYPAMTAILAACAALNWRVFDGTRQGAFVAVLCGIAAPLSELVIIRLGLWHYLQPDLFGSQGVPQWVSCCYIFYTAPVSNLARTVLRQQ